MMKKSHHSKKKATKAFNITGGVEDVSGQMSSMLNQARVNVSSLKQEYAETSKKPTSKNALTTSVRLGAVILDTYQLFYKFRSHQFYPLDKVLDVAETFQNHNITLQFRGVEQLTDMFFCVLLHWKLEKKVNLDTVLEVDLTGCHNLTDLGVEWLSQCFSAGLEKINLSGCKHITEDGLIPLLTNCKGLKSVDLTGTDVAILPRALGKMEVAYSGCPILSSNVEETKTQGLTSTEPDFTKFGDNVVQICVIRSASVTQSLVKLLSGSTTLTADPAEYLPGLKLGNIKANVTEIDKSLVDLFVHKRTAYILTYEGEKANEVAKELFTIICHVLSKEGNATFTLLGMSSSKTCAKPEEVMKLVNKMAEQTSEKLPRVADLTLKGMDYSQQIDAANKQKFITSLSFLKCTAQSVDMHRKVTEQTNLLKALETAAEIASNNYPAFKEINRALYMYLTSKSLDEALKNGAASISNVPRTIVRTMELHHMLGNAVCLYFDDGTKLAVKPDQLALLLTAMLGSPEQKNNMRVSMVPDNTPVHTPDTIMNVLKGKLNQAQVVTASGLLLKLPLGTAGSVYLCFKYLMDAPPVKVEEYFPPKPSNMAVVKQKFTFNHSVESVLIHRLAARCSQLRTPSAVWQNGIIMQDGYVDSLIQLTHNNDISCLTLISQSPIVKNDAKELALTMSWRYASLYKLLAHYVIRGMGLTFEFALESEEEKPGGVQPVISMHKIDVTKGGSGKMLCTECGMHGAVSQTVWMIYQAMSPVHMEESTIRNMKDPNYVRNGCLLRPTENNAEVDLNSVMSGFEQNSVKYTLLETDKQFISISLRPSSSLRRKTLEYSTWNGEITLHNDSGGTTKVVPKDKGKPISDGEIVEIKLDSQTVEGKLMTRVSIYKSGQLMGDCVVKTTMYSPTIGFGGEDNKKALVMVHEHEPAPYMSMELQEGMRLEALDRLTPNLICVATIEKIDQETGQILIHFDGWTDRYDYWTDFSSDDLHPVGYMEKNGHGLANKNPALQPPKGYPGQFTWEKYCREIEHLPVPYHFFSESQCMGTPPDRTESVYIACNAFMATSSNTKADTGSMVAPCKSPANQAQLMEKKVFMSATVSQKVLNFFLDKNRFFVLLPRQCTVDDLRHPSLSKLWLNKQHNVHFLCPGLRMEILHFVNSTGIELEKFYPNLECIEEWASFLYMCYLGLMLQDDILPSKVNKIMPTFADKLERDKMDVVERGLHRLCYMYMLWMSLYKTSIMDTAANMDSVLKFILTVSQDDAEVSKQLFQNFHGFNGTGHVRCMGHHLSVNLPAEGGVASLAQFEEYLQFLQKVDFQRHNMEELSEDFFIKFSRVEDLNLSDNNIPKIPSSITVAEYITHLNVSRNQLTALPDEMKELSDTLVSLDISHNPFGDLPQCVLKLKSLTHLYAQNIGKVSSLQGIKEMTSLKVFCIGFNILESIPAELKDLPLEELDLSGVPWFPYLATERVNPTLARLKSICSQYIAYRQLPPEELEKIFKRIDKDSNGTLENEELVELNKSFFELFPRFGKDKLANPKTGGVPEVVYQLKALKKLSLEYHALTEITDHIGELTQLRSINFSNTNIVSLSPHAGRIPLKEIHIQDCPYLKTPPKEVVQRGFNAVYGYLKRLSQGATSCRRTKLMMVGLGGAGKTSLVESLMSSYGTADLDYEEAITDGIDICQWEIPVKGGESIHFSVWDFAGQTVYYNTHQFFLSNRAIYLLVWNIRLGYEHAGLDFWLSSIACHAPKAPILIIGTHCDKVEKSSIPMLELKKSFPQIRDFFFVSSYTGEGIANLQNELKTVALEQKYMGEKVPEAWLELERKIMKYREGSNKIDLLPWGDVETVADECGILEYTEVVQAVEFLNDLGSVIFFNTEFLKGYVVIFPQWIVDVMACIVTVHVGPIKEGKLYHKDMGTVWGKYPENLRPWLLRLTEEFDLTFPLKDEEANLVPCLLPDTITTYDWPTVDTDKGERETKMIYTFKYLPAGLFNRAQVRLHGYSEGGKIWKKGMYLKKNDHLAIILQNSKCEVLAKAQGYKPENILYLVHEVFEALIQESYAGVEYDFCIPCIECQNMNLTDPSMFSASKVYRAVELQAPFLQCDNMFHTLSIPELQALMPPDKSSDFDSHLRRSIQELKDINEDININVCFVFCKANVPKEEAKKDAVDPFTIMADLREHGFLVSYCDNPETADLGTLTLSFKAAKVVIIGMSDEFAANEQCKKLFIYVKETLRMPFLLVVLGKGKAWSKSDLSLNITSEVYVKMDDIKRYPFKIKEMFEAIKRKMDNKSVVEDNPKCFISYCWSNSKAAIDKGSQKKEGALGWGDPRKLKHFMEKAGIKCWLDIERVGGKGLFEDIADGLRKAKIMVACVSDEYADSDICKIEYRFAASQLKIPVIIAVVGTGYIWERTEIGMLAVGNKYPKVNLQYENPSGLLEILKMVQEKMPPDSNESDSAKLEKQKEASFQEVLEITQRQFLRQCIHFSDSMYTAHYPRLIMVDFVQEKMAEEAPPPPCTGGREEEEEGEKSERKVEKPVSEGPKDSGRTRPNICYRLLCESEEGWHEADTMIPFPQMNSEDEEEWLLSIAPYMARIMAVLKYTNLPLPCLNTTQGKQLQQKFEVALVESQEKIDDFKEAYTKAREAVMDQDREKTFGGLKRCHLLNGKICWLCEKHSKESGSKTEKKYQDVLSVKAKGGVATPKINKRESVINRAASAARSPAPDTVPQIQPQVFQMRQMHGAERRSKGPGGLKRQTSQACSVM